MLIVTDKAADKIQELLTAGGKDSESWGLRVGVNGGGCSGLMYVMDFDQAKDDDQIFENEKAKVIIDGKSLPFIDGSAVDYNDGLQGAGFVIKNPKETGSCGCGASFSVG